MKVTHFETAPKIGTVLVLLGQHYVLKGSEHHQRADEYTTLLLRWMSHCSDCGRPFHVTTGLAIRYLNRRCPQHHRPGKVVAPSKTPANGGHRHG